MPEGDTIHRAAADLRAAFGADPLTTVEVRASGIVPGVAAPRPGDRLTGVEARGKHLLIAFDGGTTLHVHLGMRGAWRIRSAGAPAAAAGGRPARGRAARRPRLPPERTGVALATAVASAICRSAPVVELLDDAAIRRHDVLRSLGPDLCDPDVDLDEVLDRLTRADPGVAIGILLLDQRVASGVGNVYRSEVLWARRLDPHAPLGTLDDPDLRALYAEASALLRANLSRPGPRRTVPEGLAVYERAGRPCRRCGARIRSGRLGDPLRTAWWCPACQTRR